MSYVEPADARGKSSDEWQTWMAGIQDGWNQHRSAKTARTLAKAHALLASLDRPFAYERAAPFDIEACWWASLRAAQCGVVPETETVDLSITGEINESLAFNSRIALMAANASRVVLRINSEGGFFSGARQLHDMVAHYRSPATAIAEGRCSSAAVLVLLAADERVARPGTKFLLHPAKGGTVEDNVAVDAIIRQAAEDRGVNMEIYDQQFALATHFDTDTALKAALITAIHVGGAA